MNVADGDGITYRESLEMMLARPNLNPGRRAGYEAELQCPPFPMGLAPIWRTFWRLRRRKGSSGVGLLPIEWPDIDAFTRHSGVKLLPREVALIEALDDLFLDANAPKPSSGQDAES